MAIGFSHPWPVIDIQLLKSLMFFCLECETSISGSWPGPSPRTSQVPLEAGPWWPCCGSLFLTFIQLPGDVPFPLLPLCLASFPLWPAAKNDKGSLGEQEKRDGGEACQGDPGSPNSSVSKKNKCLWEMSPGRSAEQDRNAGEVEGMLCASRGRSFAKNVDGWGCQSTKDTQPREASALCKQQVLFQLRNSGVEDCDPQAWMSRTQRCGRCRPGWSGNRRWGEAFEIPQPGHPEVPSAASVVVLGPSQTSAEQ